MALFEDMDAVYRDEARLATARGLIAGMTCGEARDFFDRALHGSVVGKLPPWAEAPRVPQLRYTPEQSARIMNDYTRMFVDELYHPVAVRSDYLLSPDSPTLQAVKRALGDRWPEYEGRYLAALDARFPPEKPGV